MKKTILPLILMASALQITAQDKTFAFTSENKGGYQWTALREVNISEGTFMKNIITSKAIPTIKFESQGVARGLQQNNSITGNGVAAAAFDKTHNRLYFSEMWGNELKFIDLNKSELTINTNYDINFSTGNKNGENNVVTRMAFANDGIGYALTNDGKNMIRFTTGENPVITNLGQIKDSYKNTTISIHTQCTSWGGDMVGDVYGNLYLFTLRNHIFKINTNTLIAEYIGVIKNIPAEFTTNGAAADEDGNILISSANNAANYYKVNPSTLQAIAIAVKNEAYNVSDMANGNLIYQSRGTNQIVKSATDILNPISVFPNPVNNKNVNLQFANGLKGSYNVVITSTSGKTIETKKLQLSGEKNQSIALPKSVVAGLYMIRMVDEAGKTIYNTKLMVQ